MVQVPSVLSAVQTKNKIFMEGQDYLSISVQLIFPLFSRMLKNCISYLKAVAFVMRS